MKNIFIIIILYIISNNQLLGNSVLFENNPSFFSYPSAIAYEYHQPLSDLDEKGKHYFTLLFDY